MQITRDDPAASALHLHDRAGCAIGVNRRNDEQARQRNASPRNVGGRAVNEMNRDSAAILPVARRTFEVVVNRNNGTLYDVAILLPRWEALPTLIGDGMHPGLAEPTNDHACDAAAASGH